jgi:hypothetical protein
MTRERLSYEWQASRIAAEGFALMTSLGEVRLYPYAFDLINVETPGDTLKVNGRPTRLLGGVFRKGPDGWEADSQATLLLPVQDIVVRTAAFLTELTRLIAAWELEHESALIAAERVTLNNEAVGLEFEIGQAEKELAAKRARLAELESQLGPQVSPLAKSASSAPAPADPALEL